MFEKGDIVCLIETLNGEETICVMQYEFDNPARPGTALCAYIKGDAILLACCDKKLLKKVTGLQPKTTTKYAFQNGLQGSNQLIN